MAQWSDTVLLILCFSCLAVDEGTGPSSPDSRHSLRMNSQVILRLLVKAHLQPLGGLRWRWMASWSTQRRKGQALWTTSRKWQHWLMPLIRCWGNKIVLIMESDLCLSSPWHCIIMMVVLQLSKTWVLLDATCSAREVPCRLLQLLQWHCFCKMVGDKGRIYCICNWNITSQLSFLHFHYLYLLGMAKH